MADELARMGRTFHILQDKEITDMPLLTRKLLINRKIHNEAEQR